MNRRKTKNREKEELKRYFLKPKQAEWEKQASPGQEAKRKKKTRRMGENGRLLGKEDSAWGISCQSR